MTGGNSVTNATSRSLEAPSPPEPPVTTDPALTNVTGDNYQQRRLLIGQQPTILTSHWSITSSASFININFVPEPGPGQRRHSMSGGSSGVSSHHVQSQKYWQIILNLPLVGLFAKLVDQLELYFN